MANVVNAVTLAGLIVSASGLQAYGASISWTKEQLDNVTAKMKAHKASWTMEETIKMLQASAGAGETSSGFDGDDGAFFVVKIIGATVLIDGKDVTGNLGSKTTIISNNVNSQIIAGENIKNVQQVAVDSAVSKDTIVATGNNNVVGKDSQIASGSNNSASKETIQSANSATKNTTISHRSYMLTVTATMTFSLALNAYLIADKVRRKRRSK